MLYTIIVLGILHGHGWPSMAIHGHPWPMMAVWDSHGVMVFPGIPTHRVPPASAATPKTYFAPPGQWTSDLANAQTYPNMTTFIWAPGLRALSFSTRSLLCPVWMSNSYLLLLNAAKHYLHIYIYISYSTCFIIIFTWLNLQQLSQWQPNMTKCHTTNFRDVGGSTLVAVASAIPSANMYSGCIAFTSRSTRKILRNQAAWRGLEFRMLRGHEGTTTKKVKTSCSKRERERPFNQSFRFVRSKAANLIKFVTSCLQCFSVIFEIPLVKARMLHLKASAKSPPTPLTKWIMFHL